MSRPPSLATVARDFFRIGVGTFGSGHTTMILLGENMVRRGWMPQSSFDAFYTLSRVVPGTNLIAFVAACGHAARGWPGAVAAVFALSVPASAVVILLTLAYLRWNDHPVGRNVIEFAMASIVGILAGASVLLILPRLRAGRRGRTLLIAAASLVLSAFLGPLPILALAAAAGWFWSSE
jgi:chromate transporter